MTFIPNSDFRVAQAIRTIKETYNVDVSVEQKKKNLLKFGTHTSIGTGWETLAEMQDSETEETFVSTNAITHAISTASTDAGKTLNLEYHTVSGSDATFGVQAVTLNASNGQTAAALTTPCFRANRAYNTSSTALVGNIAFYEGGSVTSGKPNVDSSVHLLLTAGDQQTQRAATTISANDYWIITNISLSVTEKSQSWAEARLEAKPIATTYWRPITQNFSANDSSGTTELLKDPFIVVPANYDVRLAVRCNSASISVSGGFNGMLASVI